MAEMHKDPEDLKPKHDGQILLSSMFCYIIDPCPSYFEKHPPRQKLAYMALTCE